VFLDAQELAKRKIRFERLFHPGSFNFMDKDVRQLGDVRAEGVAEMVDPAGVREIRIRGELRGRVETPCARCLEAIPMDVSGPLDLFYRPMAQIAKEEAVAITAADAEIGFYEGNGLELADVVREQILMALPMQTLCRQDCRGLCPACGKNRNQEACGCHQEFPDPRWEALRGWKQ